MIDMNGADKNRSVLLSVILTFHQLALPLQSQNKKRNMCIIYIHIHIISEIDPS